MARKRLKRQEPSPAHIAVGCIFLLIAIVVSAANAHASADTGVKKPSRKTPVRHAWSARV